jgi:hypothetical protein
MEGNIRIYRLLKGRGTDQWKWYCRAGGEGNIYFMVRTATRGQSVYPDIALYISNYCVYWIEDTQNINVPRNQEILTETAILGIDKTLHTNEWTFLMYF